MIGEWGGTLAEAADREWQATLVAFSLANQMGSFVWR